MSETSEVGSGVNKTYRIIRITPEGWHFQRSKKRFRTIAKSDWVKDNLKH